LKAIELKKLLEKVSDDTIIVVHGEDHSYRRGYVTVTQAEENRFGLSEYWEGESLSDKSSKIITVILVD
jgi:hypothetical protein